MIVVSKLFSKTFNALKGHWFQAICVFFVFNLMIGLVQAIPGIGGFLSLIISGPLTVGICVYSLNIIRDNFPKAEDLIFGFKFNLGNGVLAYFILIPIILVSGFILMILFLAINFSIYLLILSVYYSQSYEAFTLSMDWEALLSPFRLFFDLGILNSILMVLFLVISFCFSLILPWIIVSIPFAMTFYIMAEDTSTDAWDAIQQSWKMMKGFKRSYLWLNVILLFMMIPISIFTLFIGLLWFIPFSCIITAIFYEEIKSQSQGKETQLID